VALERYEGGKNLSALLQAICNQAHALEDALEEVGPIVPLSYWEAHPLGTHWAELLSLFVNTTKNI